MVKSDERATDWPTAKMMHSDRENLVRGAAPFGTAAPAAAPTGSGSNFRSASPATLPVSGDIEAQQPEPTLLQQSSNPAALISHLFFRSAAVFVYMFSWLVTSNFVIIFVVIILLLAFDFWTVKNVTGRLLVGLRWWNEIRDDGTSDWVFESHQNRTANIVDSRVFWYALYAAPVVWTLLAVLAVFRLQASWFVVTIVAILMSMANLVGYMQCEKDAKKKKKGTAANQNDGGPDGIVSGLIGRAVTAQLGLGGK